MSWWLYPVAGVAGAWLTLFLHELSHVIVAKFVGWTITGFKPWPHRQSGRFWFGRYGSVWLNARPVPDASRWRHLAPLLKSVAVTPLWLSAGLWVHPAFFLLAAWEALDALWWWKGYFFGTTVHDGMRWRSGLR